jgi:hypothetical protein
MSIAGGIIQIVVILLPVILASIAAHNTPEAKKEQANEEVDKAIVNGDTDVINRIVHDKLQD